ADWCAVIGFTDLKILVIFQLCGSAFSQKPIVVANREGYARTRRCPTTHFYGKSFGARDWLDSKSRHHQPRVMNSLNRFADPVYCIMRLVLGLTYACHGSQKLLSIPGGGHGAAGIALIAGFVELFAGLGIAFGLLTRLAAF